MEVNEESGIPSSIASELPSQKMREFLHWASDRMATGKLPSECPTTLQPGSPCITSRASPDA
eukprot:258672-Rhodomonas_salina.1